jgi:hypothetical protein
MSMTKFKFKGNTMYDRVKGTVVRNGNIVESDKDMIALHPGLFEIVPQETELTVLESSNLRRIDPRLLKPKVGVGASIPHLDKLQPAQVKPVDPDPAEQAEATLKADADKKAKAKKG